MKFGSLSPRKASCNRVWPIIIISRMANHVSRIAIQGRAKPIVDVQPIFSHELLPLNCVLVVGLFLALQRSPGLSEADVTGSTVNDVWVGRSVSRLGLVVRRSAGKLRKDAGSIPNFGSPFS